MSLISHAEEEKRKKSYGFRIIKWLFDFTIPYRRYIIFSVFLVLLTAWLELSIPYMTKIAVDSYILPQWREVELSGKENRFEEGIKEKYKKDIIPLGGGLLLINLAAVEKADKLSLEKLDYISDERYLVLKGQGIKEGGEISRIIGKHKELFRSVEGNVFAIKYSSLNNFTEEELKVLRGEEIRGVYRLGFLVILALISVFLLSSLYTYILNYSGYRIMYEIRTRVFSHVLSLHQRFFDKNPVGRLVTRVTNDVEAVNEMYTSVFTRLISDFIIIFGVLIIMYRMNSRLTLIIFALGGILGVVAYLFGVKLREVYREIRRKIAKLNTFIQESIRGITIIKLYLRERENLRRFKEVNTEHYRANMNQLFAFATFRPIIDFVGTLAAAVILWYGGLRILKGDLTLGALIAYLAYIRMLFRPVMELAEKYNVFQSAVAASENLFELVNTPTEDRNTGKTLSETSGKLEFKNVWFSYDGDGWVLRDVSFRVHPGETLALVGLTGSGKSTIVNLLLRLYEIQKGEILLDGVNIKELDPVFLRSNFSVVFQDLFLFGGDTGNGGDSIQKKVEEFIKITGQEGALKKELTLLSSGEKQILSLGRAITRSSKILILDEATSNLDPETESRIRYLVMNGFKKRTKLIIAHRLSTIKDVDRIIVIHRGKIHEVGNHEELINKKDLYYNLYTLQNVIYQTEPY